MSPVRARHTELTLKRMATGYQWYVCIPLDQMAECIAISYAIPISARIFGQSCSMSRAMENLFPLPAGTLRKTNTS